jgi:hypothetical protein
MENRVSIHYFIKKAMQIQKEILLFTCELPLMVNGWSFLPTDLLIQSIGNRV